MSNLSPVWGLCQRWFPLTLDHLCLYNTRWNPARHKCHFLGYSTGGTWSSLCPAVWLCLGKLSGPWQSPVKAEQGQHMLFEWETMSGILRPVFWVECKPGCVEYLLWISFGCTQLFWLETMGSIKNSFSVLLLILWNCICIFFFFRDKL